MAWWETVLTTQLGDLNLIPESTCWKKKTDSCKLSSVFYRHLPMCICTHLPADNKV